MQEVERDGKDFWGDLAVISASCLLDPFLQLGSYSNLSTNRAKDGVEGRRVTNIARPKAAE